MTFVTLWAVLCLVSLLKDYLTYRRLEEGTRFTVFTVGGAPLKRLASLGELEEELIFLRGKGARVTDNVTGAFVLALPWSEEVESHFSMQWANKSQDIGLFFADTTLVFNIYADHIDSPGQTMLWILVGPLKALMWPFQEAALSRMTQGEVDTFHFCAIGILRILPAWVNRVFVKSLGE